MTEEVQTEQQETVNVFANFFAGIVGLLVWMKKPQHIAIISTTAMLAGGTATVMNRINAPKPGGVDRANASLSNDVKLIDKLDSTYDMVQGLVKNQYSLQTELPC